MDEKNTQDELKPTDAVLCHSKMNTKKDGTVIFQITVKTSQKLSDKNPIVKLSEAIDQGNGEHLARSLALLQGREFVSKNAPVQKEGQTVGVGHQASASVEKSSGSN